MHELGDARYLTFRRLDQEQGLRHLFTTRWGGISKGPCENWNLGSGTGHNPDTPENRKYNVAMLARCMGTTPDRTVWTDQTHTTNIRVVTEEDLGKGGVRPMDYTDVDGLVTDRPEVCLITLHADCNAVYFFDPVRRVIGLAHSGWKGTLNQISACMVSLMKDRYGTRPENLICGIGPSLCQDCFEVDEDVAELFFQAGLVPRPDQSEQAENLEMPGSPTCPDTCGASAPRACCRDLVYSLVNGDGITKYYINLWKIIDYTLTAEGVKKENILTMGLCTKENLDTFFSHRGQHGWRGLMAAAMMLTGE